MLEKSMQEFSCIIHKFCRLQAAGNPPRLSHNGRNGRMANGMAFYKTGWRTEWCNQKNAIAGIEVPNWVLALLTIIMMLIIYNIPLGSQTHLEPPWWMEKRSMGDVFAEALEDGAVEITFIDDEGKRKRAELPLELAKKLSAQLQSVLATAEVRATITGQPVEEWVQNVAMSTPRNMQGNHAWNAKGKCRFCGMTRVNFRLQNRPGCSGLKGAEKLADNQNPVQCPTNSGKRPKALYGHGWVSAGQLSV
jgi:hypothetical protein